MKRKLKPIFLADFIDLKVIQMSEDELPADVMIVIKDNKDFVDTDTLLGEYLVGVGQFEGFAKDEDLAEETREAFAYLYKKLANVSYIMFTRI